MSKVSHLSVNQFDAPFGAEVVGVDLSRDLDSATIDTIQNALNLHSVIVLRKQQLAPQDMLRFSRHLGEVSDSVVRYQHKDVPGVYVLSNILEDDGRPVGLADAGPIWHTDGSYFAEPHAYTLLYALEVPHNGNTPLGDTQFVSTAKAYDALSDDLKMRLKGLRAVHRLRNPRDRGLTAEQLAKNPDRIHPLVRTHPRSGRKCIYVNELYTVGIVGMPEDEARSLLDELEAHCIRSDFYYRHKWRVGDIVICDNCAAQHKSTLDYALPLRRLLYRTTVKGTIPY